MPKKRLVLVGGGGHAKVVIDAIREAGFYEICGIVDPALKKGTRVLGVKVLGGDKTLPEIFKNGIRHAFIGVGSIGDFHIREDIYKHIKAIGFKLPVVTHPKSVVAKGVYIGEGTFIAARAVVNTGTWIGRNVIINTSSSVDHDCTIEGFAHIAPGAVLSGGVKVGYGTHIGTGAKVIQNVTIGRECMIGSGEVIRRTVQSNTRYITPYVRKRRVFIIAEAGINHNGSVRLAKKMVDIAKRAGADAIKFQTFSAEELATRYAPKAEYQKRDKKKRESQLGMLKKLELNGMDHKKIIEHCKKRGIKFLSSPFDLKGIDLLKGYGLDIYKIPSGQITDLPYLKKIGGLKKKVILSSGMSSLKDVGRAVRVLVRAGTRRSDITVLHCNTEYPTPYRDVNLSAMLTIRKRFKLKVGYSDHTPGIEVPVAAASLGAEVIEKHFTLDKKMAGPDHKASLDPGELERMVKAVRNIEEILGDGVKRVTPSEFKNKDIVRKSIVASRRIRKGEIFSEKNLTTKRPAKGISPMEWCVVLGTPAKRDFKKDELIEI